MKRDGAICPECNSTNIKKEKINGQDTMDLVCENCNYAGWWKDFQLENELNKDHPEQ